MIGVTVGTVADDLRIDFGVSLDGMFSLFQNQDAASFSHDKTASFFVEGNAGAVFVGGMR